MVRATSERCMVTINMEDSRLSNVGASLNLDAPVISGDMGKVESGRVRPWPHILFNQS